MAPACRRAAALPNKGSAIFAAKCAACHGENGKGGSAAALIGGQPLTSGIETAKTVANFWPYATTIFDFTRRAMPWPRPRTLTNEEVYALTAFILAQNKIIGGHRRDERADAAQGAHAESRRLHPEIPRTNPLTPSAFRVMIRTP